MTDYSINGVTLKFVSTGKIFVCLFSSQSLISLIFLFHYLFV